MEYFKHLANRYGGKVALVWQEWEEFGAGRSAVGDDQPPRGARLWHPQFARKREQAEKLRRLPQDQNGQVPHGVDLRERVGDTTVLRWREGSDGHWRLRGGALSLSMLWQRFGCLFTAAVGTVMRGGCGRWRPCGRSSSEQ